MSTTSSRRTLTSQRTQPSRFRPVSIAAHGQRPLVRQGSLLSGNDTGHRLRRRPLDDQPIVRRVLGLPSSELLTDARAYPPGRDAARDLGRAQHERDGTCSSHRGTGEPHHAASSMTDAWSPVTRALTPRALLRDLGRVLDATSRRSTSCGLQSARTARRSPVWPLRTPSETPPALQGLYERRFNAFVADETSGVDQSSSRTSSGSNQG